MTEAFRPRPDYQALFDAAPASYVVLDPRDLVIIAVSDAFLRDTMTTLDQLVGQVIFDVFPDNPDDAGATGTANLRESLDRVVRNKVPDTMAVQKYDIKQPDEAGGQFEVRYWNPVSSPVIGPDGGVDYILVQTQDVTEYVRLKEKELEHLALATRLQQRTERMEADIVSRSRELQEANRLLRAADSAKNEFLSRVSHELRTPLNAVLGFGQLLSLGNLTGEDRESAAMILKAGRHLVRLLDEMLDISRIEAGQLSLSVQPVPVHDVIADVLEMIRPLAETSGVHLGPAPPAGRYVLADYQRLHQILLNMASNAVKYNRRGGTVAVTLSTRPGRRLRIEVSDTGQGISQQALARLFTPFERLDAAQAGIEGTGLGLAVCRELVRAMDGDTGVSSIEGSGSTFWIELPEARAAAAAQHTPAPRPAGPAGPAAVSWDAGEPGNPAASRAYATAKTVLYIEDVAENLRLVERILQRRPYVTLLAAAFGQAGIDLAEEYHPDLILLDVHLPDMTGDEVLGRLRASAATSTIPIVVLSADATKHQVDRLLDAGAAAYLTKPVNVRELLQTIDEVIGEPQPTS